MSKKYPLHPSKIEIDPEGLSRFETTDSHLLIIIFNVFLCFFYFSFDLYKSEYINYYADSIADYIGGFFIFKHCIVNVISEEVSGQRRWLENVWIAAHLMSIWCAGLFTLTLSKRVLYAEYVRLVSVGKNKKEHNIYNIINKKLLKRVSVILMLFIFVFILSYLIDILACQAGGIAFPVFDADNKTAIFVFSSTFSSYFMVSLTVYLLIKTVVVVVMFFVFKRSLNTESFVRF